MRRGAARRAALGRAVRAHAVHRRDGRARPSGCSSSRRAPAHRGRGERRAHPGPRRGRGRPAARPARGARRGAGGRALTELAAVERLEPGVWHRLHPLSPFVRAGRAAIGLAIVFVPALVSGRDFFGSLVDARDPRRRRRARVRLVARHALAGREPGAADRDGADPPQLAALSARAGAGDRRDRAGPRRGSSASPSCACGWAATPAATRGSPTSPPARRRSLRARLLALAKGVAVDRGAADRRARAGHDPDRPARRRDPLSDYGLITEALAIADRRDRRRVAGRGEGPRRQRLPPAARHAHRRLAAVQQRLPR